MLGKIEIGLEAAGHEHRYMKVLDLVDMRTASEITPRGYEKNGEEKKSGGAESCAARAAARHGCSCIAIDR